MLFVKYSFSIATKSGANLSINVLISVQISRSFKSILIFGIVFNIQYSIKLILIHSFFVIAKPVVVVQGSIPSIIILQF